LACKATYSCAGSKPAARTSADDISEEKTVADTERSSAGPSEFLGQLAADLEARAGTDKHLAKVLVEHLLTASPKADCVTVARLAINDLAKARAAAPAQDTQDA
jgi:hypothetical protein